MVYMRPLGEHGYFDKDKTGEDLQKMQISNRKSGITEKAHSRGEFLEMPVEYICDHCGDKELAALSHNGHPVKPSRWWSRQFNSPYIRITLFACSTLCAKAIDTNIDKLEDDQIEKTPILSFREYDIDELRLIFLENSGV